MKNIVRHIIAGAVMPVLLLASALQSCSHGDRVSPCEITDEMDSLVENSFPGDNAPGAVITVMKDGKICYRRSIGQANLKTGEMLSGHTLMNISSATKSFTVAGLLKLAERGEISLEDSLLKFFPDYNAEVFGKVKLKHIISHTSGLPDNRPRTDRAWKVYIKHFPNTIFGNSVDYMHYGTEKVLTRFYTCVDTLASEPGTTFFYQDPTFMLMSQVIEKVTGEDFEVWMKKNIFDAAGLTTARFTNGKMEGKGISHGYRPKTTYPASDIFVSKDSLWEEFDYGESIFFRSRADKGVYITPDEYANWLNALYGGKVVSQASLDSMTVRRIDTEFRGMGYGYGTYVAGGNGTSRKLVHTNGNGGFTIIEAVYPDDNVAYYIFSNFFQWNRIELSRKIDAVLESHGWITG